MYSKRSRWSWSLLALPVIVLAGCSMGVEKFSELDSQQEKDKSHLGVLVPSELDLDGNGIISPADELRGANTYARSVTEFFADGDTDGNGELTKDEFAKALLGNRMPPWQIGLIALGVIAIPIPLGLQLAKSLRMPDHGWKIALVLVTVCSGATIAYFGWPPNLGIDLSGGVIMIYEIDEEATRLQLGGADEEEEQDPTAGSDLSSDELAQQIRKRINPGGVSEIVVRPYGPRQVEIIIPNVEEAEIDYYQSLIERTGQLEFLIVANRRDHQQMIDKALSNVDQLTSTIENEDGKTVGRWVPAGVAKATREKPETYQGVGLSDIVRAKQDGKYVAVDMDLVARQLTSEDITKGTFGQLGYTDVQVLMKVDPNERRNVKGNHVRSADVGTDQIGKPAVHFSMNSAGAVLLGSLTSRNMPDEANNHFRRMAIIMDNQVISAPRLNDQISDRGIITGDFTEDEVRELVGVLKAGRLPAVMRKDPISVNQVSSLLGADTIRSGAIAIGISLAVVLIFMILYYRFAGVVACLALVINMLLILALMILIDATFTLPGIAGLVLTVGMSVDANVLIYERIREELNRGAALRMAIRNGFQRATTTIVDANLTTLITAIVLYVIGTDQIRGFAVTLILGILMSMYTAIFCSRIVFDIAERRRWISSLGMMQIVGNTQVDFLGRRKIAGFASIVLILIGLGALVMRGKDILDIDFLGGTSVQMLLKSPMPIGEVRDRVEDGRLGDVSVVGVQVTEEGEDEPGTSAKAGESVSFIINSSITGEEPPEEGDPVRHTKSGETEAGDYTVTKVQLDQETADLKSVTGEVLTGVKFANIERDGVKVVEKRLIEKFKDEMQFHSVEVIELAAIEEEFLPEKPADNPTGGISIEPKDPTGEEGDDSSPSGIDPADTEPTDTEPEGTDAETPTDGTSSAVNNSPFKLAAFQEVDEIEVESTEEETAGVDESASDEPTSSGPTSSDLEGRSLAKLKFDHAMTASNVESMIRDALVKKYGDDGLPAIVVKNDQWSGASGRRFDEWDVEIPLTYEASKQLLNSIESEQAAAPVWLSSNKIGGQVAGNLQQQAVAALLASLIGIIGYIWLRFQRVVFGLAAVVALVHDVLITLGAIAISLWIAKATMGVLLVDEFKISLPIVAALLTIIGYSLNDTIVVFDRIREVRGKNPDLTQEMINTSINQTLGRTLLTSFTTLIVVLLLYILGGQAIRGFAFALLVGVMVGTYSSIFIASPALLWMVNATKESNAPKASASSKNKPAAATDA